MAREEEDFGRETAERFGGVGLVKAGNQVTKEIVSLTTACFFSFF